MRGAAGLNAIHATPALNAKAEPKLQLGYFGNHRGPHPTTLRNQPEDIICTGTAQLPAPNTAKYHKSVPPVQQPQNPPPGSTFFSSAGSAARSPAQPSRKQHRARLVSMVKGLSPLPRPSFHQIPDSQSKERRATLGTASKDKPAATSSGGAKQNLVAAGAMMNQAGPHSRQVSKGVSIQNVASHQGKGDMAHDGGA